MKLTPRVKAVLAVLVVAGLLAVGWLKYYEFLMSGRRPPESTQLLAKMEKEGVPSFTLKDVNSHDVSLSDYAGKIVLLNFWASWCDPCIAEFPSMLKLIERYKGEVVLLAISADFEKRDILTFLRAFKANSPHLKVAWDKDLTVAKMFGTFKLPESYIIGRDGKLIRKIAGVDDWSTPDAFRFFDELVNSHAGAESQSTK